MFPGPWPLFCPCPQPRPWAPSLLSSRQSYACWEPSYVLGRHRALRGRAATTSPDHRSPPRGPMVQGTHS